MYIFASYIKRRFYDDDLDRDDDFINSRRSNSGDLQKRFNPRQEKFTGADFSHPVSIETVKNSG